MKYFLITPIFIISFFITSLQADGPRTQDKSLRNHPPFINFMRFIGSKLEAFQKNSMPPAQSVFYPFGGPDLLYPLLLFPQAKIYVLVGLEPLGQELSLTESADVFNNLGSLFRRGFFVTASMAENLDRKVGVRALLALQIKLMGGKILKEDLLHQNALTFSFEWENQEKTIYYFRQNLAENADNLFEFLTTNNLADACMIKSASYLLHKAPFSSLKTKILRHFPLLVQDDTGVPLKDLGNYEIFFFGHYNSPYGEEFRNFVQSDLREAYACKNTIPRLNFCYGYGCGRVQANLIIARRKKPEAKNFS